MLVLFAVIESKVANPLFTLSLFRIRAFTLGNIAILLSSLGRGGLQFILIIWLQGVWLPQHGYSFEQTPLWAGIYMLPLTLGFLLAAPASGYLSDRFGAPLVRQRRHGAHRGRASSCWRRCRSTSTTGRSRRSC